MDIGLKEGRDFATSSLSESLVHNEAEEKYEDYEKEMINAICVSDSLPI